MIELLYDRRAIADLAEIRAYIAAENEQAADRVLTHLEKQIERLRNRPRLGKPTSDPDIRILYPTKYPYRIYYLMSAQEVVVVHVRHTSRAPPKPSELSRS